MVLSRSAKIVLVILIAAAAAVGGSWWYADARNRSGPDLTDARRAIARKDYDAVVEIVAAKPSVDAKTYVRHLGVQLGPAAAPVLTRLVDRRVEPREDVRAWSATALNAAIPAETPKDPNAPAVTALVAALKNDPSPAVRASAATTLGYTRTYQTMGDLFEAMNDPQLSVRRAAGRAVAKITRLRLYYRPDAPEPQRLEQIRKLKLWWSDVDNRGLVGGYYDSGRFKAVYEKYAR